MITHLLKLVWNRKRSNLLIVAEIFVCFLVTFGVLTAAIGIASSWREPLGFEWRDVWNVELGFEADTLDQTTPEVRASIAAILQELESMPEVVAAAYSVTPPYSFSANEMTRPIEGKSTTLLVDDVSDSFVDVMGLRMLEGRWFNAEDDAAADVPIVVDSTFARNVFGGRAIGKRIESTEPSESTLRVIGVIGPYRKDGETALPQNMIFRRMVPAAATGMVPRHIVAKIRPGTPAAFEQELVSRLQRVAPGMSFSIRTLEQMRERNHRARLAPLVAGGIVAIFLVSMVALGLTGVLWQNVTRRTRELGVRRAMGATRGNVHRQVLGEVVLLATLASVAGALVVIQLPILGILSLVTPGAFAAGLGTTLVAIYGLALVCALYPSWLASRLQPADALRYD